ncbi:hypothetical protein SUGI_0966360 [Cryptomeria japonica]|uniref:heavy metal-associated isoprenylated plant protein 21-like n=1 Tax=Cryptomeria japonica TaxID=3369 RepID=UPI002414CEE0|nr:heavy metal-associated isoprenylated plant protein 21-like [Cryptomeria japonica]GLJ45906.1 hypothetical protein SUGI_0966360 [Cryptomeria japonica]
MGVLGCGLCLWRKKHKYGFQTVELKVPMDCPGCETKVKDTVSSIKGVESVEVSREENKITVIGYVDRNKVLKEVKSGVGNSAEFWPYVPYNLVYNPCAPKFYDMEAPAGHVLNADYRYFSESNRTNERYTALFSDDNAHACTIM